MTIASVAGIAYGTVYNRTGKVTRRDPYEYRARLTMPKMIINATGDQFFVPDSSRFYFDALPGEKHLRYVPNADHSMRHTDVDETVLAFYRSTRIRTVPTSRGGQRRPPAGRPSSSS